MKKLFLGLISILFISGCIVPGLEFPNPFAQGPQVKELPPDLISIANITVLPSSSVRPQDQFSVYFEVANQDEFVPVDVDYNLYDTGLCKIKGGEPTVSTSTIGVTTDYDDSFSPQETRLVEWNFEAPSAEEIASLSVTCPIRFKFNFHYTATSEIDVLVIESGYLSQLQREGKSPTFTPTVNVGRGPVKIYFDFGTSLPVKNGFNLPVYVTVEDKGTGLLREIKSGDFKIKFPSGSDGFDLSSVDCPYFGCDTTTNLCTSNDDIPIVNKKSLQIRCSNIKTPATIVPGPEKTYFINATVDYDYAAVGEVDVEVKP